MPDVELSWTLRTRADLRSTWALLSDTDRFNRVAGVGLHFEVRPTDDGEIERLGWSRRLGMRIDWEELPFQYEAPEWFESVRRFPAGPAKELSARLELHPVEDGTEIHYRIRLTPRNALTWAVIAADARLSVRPQLDRALRSAVALLDDPGHAYDPPPPPLSAEASARLDQALAPVEPTALREALADRIRHGPLFLQKRISPLAIGARLGLDEATVVHGFLAAVRSGALALSWELLCPRCLGPKATVDALRLEPGAVHCPTCNIRYDGSFPDSVVVRFEPAPAIRAVEVPLECLLSPGRTPHIVANREIAARGTTTLRVELEPGGYLIRTEPPTGVASLEVREGVLHFEASVDLTGDKLVPALLRVAPGASHLHMRSHLDRPVQLSVERRWRPPHALTAGRLLEFEGAEALLPEEALDAGIQVRLLPQAVLFVDPVKPDPEVLARIDAVVGAHGPRRVHRSDGRTLATFDGRQAALDAAEALDGDPRLAVGLAWGTVVELAEGDAGVPAGSAVEAAVAARRSAGAGRTAVDGDPALWEDSRLQVGPRGLVKFASTAERRARRIFGTPPSIEVAPDRIGPWKVGERLASGGFGVVFAAVGPDGAPAALKLLHTDKADDPEHAQQFYNEARIASTLVHPRIVRVHDWGHTETGLLFLAMERLVGRELGDLLGDDKVMKPEAACRVAMDALDGLSAAHRAGIVHRDVKPANVFVLVDGAAKVIDFGIARQIHEELPASERGKVLGTAEYLSPEQVDRLPLDGRSDVYAVGIVLYRCLTGTLPFQANSPVATALQRLAVDPKPVDEVAPQDIPSRLARIVMRALEREPEDRFQSAAEMREALAGAVDGLDA